jgi:hypothetical protein
VRRRRWWLALASIVSLATLVVAGVTTAYSVPVAPGQRALVVPPADATRIPPGTLVAVGDPGATFPAGTLNSSIVLALAYVAPTANGSYVPATLDANLGGRNATLDVAALAGGKSGYLAHREGDANATFVETGRVLGTVSRYAASSSIVALFVGGSVGFVLPLVVLMATHRGTGRPGVPAGMAAGACPECRAPVPAGHGFCTRCGAWLQEAPP